jgi:hypothetical protein
MRRLRRLWLEKLGTGTATATATASAASGSQPQFLGERWWSRMFLVEDIERRQTDVEDFLLRKKNFLVLRVRRRLAG